MIKFAPFLLLVCLVAGEAQATVILKMKQEYISDSTKSCEVVAALETTRSRVDSDCGKKMTIIMLKNDKRMIMIDPEKKTYFETTEASLEKLQQDPMAVLEKDPKYAAQMAKMTPEQKAMMKKMMTGAMSKSMEVKTDLKKLGKQKKVNAWSCDSYGIFAGEKMIEELCLADRGQFPALAPVYDSWKDFTNHWLKITRSPTAKTHEEASKVGISVETLLYTAGKIHSRMQIEEVKSEDRPDSFFQTPTGYMKASSPLMN